MTRLLRVPQACAELAIGRSQLYELIDDGYILAVRIGSRGVRIPSSELDRFVAERLKAAKAVKAAQ